MDRALEMGCVHWDSAALYGDSEELLGKWFQRTGKRDEVSTNPLFGMEGLRLEDGICSDLAM